MLEKINEIIQFWFIDNSDKWWGGSPEFDEEIRIRFGALHRLASKGELDHWIELPKSCLAYIILLDQFSRNIYRGTPQAFTQDKLALAASEKGREHKLDKELNLVQRLFFYLPLEHSEDLNNQKLSLALMRQMVKEASHSQPDCLSMMESALSYAQQHYDIILNFGRFPYRNEILDRESTQEEIVFLSLPNSRF